jgi:hypothetical protein
MFVYITSEKNISLFDEIINKKRIIADKMTAVYDLTRIVNAQTANFSHCSHFAVDIDALQNTGGEITGAIASFSSMYPKTTVIAVYIGAEQGDKLSEDLKEIGAYVITSPEKPQQQKEIAAAWNGEKQEPAKPPAAEKPTGKFVKRWRPPKWGKH